MMTENAGKDDVATARTLRMSRVPLISASGVGATDTGRERDANEDAFLADDDLGLYIVSDGMGGHARGEVASSTAVQTAHAIIRSHRAAVEQFLEDREDSEQMTGLVIQAIQAASQEVHRLATSKRDHAGMGSTMTVLIVGGRQAILGHVGDSRLYLRRNDVIHQLTTDHTMAEELIRNGTLTPEKARESRWANVLTRSVGTQASVVVDTLVFDVLPGDRLLLCSDGLSEYLSDPSVALRLLGGELEDLPDALIAWANERGGHDNITAVVVLISPDEPLLSESLPLDSRYRMDLSTMRSIPLFAELTVPQLLRILQVGRVLSVPKDATLFAQGAHCDAATAIVRGRLKVIRANQTVALSGPGEILGGGLVLKPRPTHAGLAADQDSQIFVIDHAGLLTLQQARPRLANLLLVGLGRHLAETVERQQREHSTTQPGSAPPAERPADDYI
ncbi:MAG: protein phosphatase 2C domain-containing protein [bacterium]